MDGGVKRELLKYPNVVGVSNTTKPRIRRGVVIPEEQCVRVYVEEKKPLDQLKPDEVIPSEVEVDGERVKTDVVQIGRVKSLATYTARYRPAPLGVSTSRADSVSAGTMGFFFIDQNMDVHLVSNNHVWAGCNAGSTGDPVIQPGRYDGGDPDKDVIGFLKGFVPMRFNNDSSNPNYVDVAWAVPISVPSIYLSIIDHGYAWGSRDPTLGEEVVKVGRTTGVTRSVVADESADIVVWFGDRPAYFSDVFLIDNKGGFARNGDSGSPVLSSSNEFTGLLFGGSDSVSVSCKQSRIVSEVSAVHGYVIGFPPLNAPVYYSSPRIAVSQHALSSIVVLSILFSFFTLSVYEIIEAVWRLGGRGEGRVVG